MGLVNYNKNRAGIQAKVRFNTTSQESIPILFELYEF